MNQQVCDPSQLASFVRGELSAEAERDLAAHLDACESCGHALERQIAEPSAWREASEFLGEKDSHGGCECEERTPGDMQIRQMLSQLLPTDDPDSLGRIGGYEVSGVVGSGGMGVVFKAHDRSLDRVVAVKVMAPHLAASGSARQRFAREAKAAAAVLHPNVIAIHGVSNEQSLPYLVMPYVRGNSLQKRIDAAGPLPLVDILRIGAQVASGLAAAHEQGLVHRDIKPGNILMEQGVERVTITDFGLARAVDDASMTRSGVITGTPQYMSPEQARGEPIDARSDLFSLGSLLYTMCTGHSPFRAETSFGVMHRITHDAPRAITELNSEIPVWLQDVVMKLLSKRPDDRIQSAGEVAKLLEGCLSHTQHPATTPLPRPVLELASAPPSRRVWHKLLAASGLIGLLVLAGVLIVLEWNKGTLRIESEADDVPIRIIQGDTVVEELTVSKSGNSVRIAAGNYRIEIHGPLNGLLLDESTVTLQRGGKDVVRIVQVAEQASELGVWPYGRLLKDLRETRPPGGAPVIPSGAPISVAMGNELTRRLAAAPAAHFENWVAELERIVGANLQGELASQACRTFIANRMSNLFDNGQWNANQAGQLLRRAKSIPTSEAQAWRQAFESLFEEAIGQTDKVEFNGGPSYAVPLALVSVDPLFEDNQYDPKMAEKLRRRLGELTLKDITSWSSLVDRFGGSKIDAAVNMMLLDDYFTDERFQRSKFAATLGGLQPAPAPSTPQGVNSSQRNLREIVGALHRYHESHGHFPTATIHGKDGSGGPPHSWRVELLPLLGKQELYEQYRFDEPWDSEHNLSLLPKMPACYRSPLDQRSSTNSSYFGVTSDDVSKRASELQQMKEQQRGFLPAEYEQYIPEATVFWKQRGASFKDMLDGTSNCIAVIEAKREVPWTQPKDIEYSADQPLPKLGGWLDEGVYVAFADGAVALLASSNDSQSVRNMLTISDGVPVQPQPFRRLRVHGARAILDAGLESVIGPEVYQAPGGPMLRIQADLQSVITEADIMEVVATQGGRVVGAPLAKGSRSFHRIVDPNDTHGSGAIVITLTEQAGQRLLAATTQLSDGENSGYLVITFDRKVVSFPRVLTPVGSKFTITGDFNGKRLAAQLRDAVQANEPAVQFPDLEGVIPAEGSEGASQAENVRQPQDASVE